MSRNARINTLVTIISTARPLRGRARLTDIRHELNEVLRVNGIAPDSRRKFLEVLHACRALETTLSEFLGYYRIRPTEPRAHSLGGYLTQLKNHRSPHLRTISASERELYQRVIVRLRNEIAHTANRYPSDAEVNSILHHLENCMAMVLALPY